MITNKIETVKNETVTKIESTKSEVSAKINSVKAIRRTSRLRTRTMEKKEEKTSEKLSEKSTKSVKKDLNISAKPGGKARQRPKRYKRVSDDPFTRYFMESVLVSGCPAI